jgi:hypothetical protein
VFAGAAPVTKAGLDINATYTEPGMGPFGPTDVPMCPPAG